VIVETVDRQQASPTTGLELHSETIFYSTLRLKMSIRQMRLIEEIETDKIPKGPPGMHDHRKRLLAFYAAVCEAIAVSAAQDQRVEACLMSRMGFSSR
jgi:hypothetical protein